MEGDHVTDFGNSLSRYDVALLGRKTYEVGLKFGVTNPYPRRKTYVFSRTMKQSPDPAVTVVSENIVQFVRELKEQDGKDIRFVGAGDVASTLFAAELIDEISVKVNPILMSEGIPLVAHLKSPTAYKLLGTKVYDNGVILSSYARTSAARAALR